jgi:hypothetical protein
LEIALTYRMGNEVFTVRGTPIGTDDTTFTLRKTEGGVLRISKRLIVKVEDIK